MRILHVDKFLRREGGAAAYMLELADLQRGAGHEPEFFSMADDRNQPATYEALFAPHVELEPPPAGLRARAVGATRLVYSRRSEAAMAAVVSDFRPDMVHLHNIYHQLTPSILRPLVRAGVPAVMTLHDYKLVCPTYRLLDQDGPCTACLDGHFRHAAQRRCKDGSLASSSLLAVETRIHRTLGSYRGVGAFLCPSRFLLGMMRAGGVFPDRLHHVPHFLDLTTVPAREGAGEGVVFAGRLSPEKGVDLLVRAVGSLPGARLTVVGDGPQRAALAALADEVAPGRVTFTGQRDRAGTLAAVRAARAAVLPARWYENQPMGVLEAMASAVPVVVSDLGGSPELVTDGETGRVVPAEDVPALAAALAGLLADPERARALGRQARARVRQDFGPEAHLAALDRVYAAARAATPRP